MGCYVFFILTWNSSSSLRTRSPTLTEACAQYAQCSQCYCWVSMIKVSETLAVWKQCLCFNCIYKYTFKNKLYCVHQKLLEFQPHLWEPFHSIQLMWGHTFKANQMQSRKFEETMKSEIIFLCKCQFITSKFKTYHLLVLRHKHARHHATH